MPKLSRHEDSAALQVNIDRHVNSHCPVRELQRDMRRRNPDTLVTHGPSKACTSISAWPHALKVWRKSNFKGEIYVPSVHRNHRGMIAGAGSTGGFLAACIAKIRKFFRANRLGQFQKAQE